MAFARTEQTYIRELQGQEPIECSQITAKIVRHHQRGSLGVRSKGIRELGCVREVMNNPSKDVRELTQGRNLRAVAEHEEAHGQRHAVDKDAGTFHDQFRVWQKGGPEHFTLVAGAETGGLPALESGTELGEEIAARACGSNVLHEDPQMAIAAIETARIELHLNGRRAEDDLPCTEGNLILETATTEHADGAAIGLHQHPRARLAIRRAAGFHECGQRPRLLAIFSDAPDDLPQSFHYYETVAPGNSSIFTFSAVLGASASANTM